MSVPSCSEFMHHTLVHNLMVGHPSFQSCLCHPQNLIHQKYQSLHIFNRIRSGGRFLYRVFSSRFLRSLKNVGVKQAFARFTCLSFFIYFSFAFSLSTGFAFSSAPASPTFTVTISVSLIPIISAKRIHAHRPTARVALATFFRFFSKAFTIDLASPSSSRSSPICVHLCKGIHCLVR